jgi:TolB protein
VNFTPLRPIRALVTVAALATLAAAPLAAQQDTGKALEQQGIRIGITYEPGVRPGLLVLGGNPNEVLDSIRTILARDLDYSDRFEMINLPGGDSLTIALAPHEQAGGGTFVNYGLYQALGADFAVHVRAASDSTVTVTLYDVRGKGPRKAITLGVPSMADPAFRMQVHRASDEIVRAVTGTPGIAASRLLFVREDGRIYRIDADGAGRVPLTPAGVKTFSPAWAPDGRHFAYTQFAGDNGAIYVQDALTGERRIVPPTAQSLNYTPAFAPDGQTIAFTQSNGSGSDIYTYNWAKGCCLQRLTVGRFSDNLSPIFSPDGSQIAFVSTRAGTPQVYVMSSEGTNQELFAPFDYGVTGESNGPDWSPDGTHIAFHRDVAGNPQVFVMDVASRTVQQLTSAGRNTDPTWAPDGTHLAFVSDRSGVRQLWVIDLQTGRVRQLTRIGETRLPAWSRRID